MTDMGSNTDDGSIHRLLLDVIRLLIARHQWKLLTEEELLTRTLSELGSIQQNVSGSYDLKHLVRLVTPVYARALHEACRQTTDIDRRELAYTELHRYLYRVAYKQWPEQAEDLAQQAILGVHKRLDHCREPGAFFVFALFELRTAIRPLTRTKPVEPLPAYIVEPPFVPGVLTQDCLERVVRALNQLPKKQRQSIWLKYIHELRDQDIAARLDIKANTVAAWRRRIRRRLRDDPSLEDCL